MSASLTGEQATIPVALVMVGSEQLYTVRSAGPEDDLTVVQHWTDLWREVGGPGLQLHSDHQERTLRFIAEARARLRYQTFVAVDSAGKIVGSASSQQWEGPFPMIALSPFLNLGTVWCVFVRPEHRRRGLGTQLIAMCIEHWKAIGCTRGILMYASELGRGLYVKAGFAPGNVLMLENVRFESPGTELKTSCQITPTNS